MNQTHVFGKSTSDTHFFVNHIYQGSTLFCVCVDTQLLRKQIHWSPGPHPPLCMQFYIIAALHKQWSADTVLTGVIRCLAHAVWTALLGSEDNSSPAAPAVRKAILTPSGKVPAACHTKGSGGESSPGRLIRLKLGF